MISNSIHGAASDIAREGLSTNNRFQEPSRTRSATTIQRRETGAVRTIADVPINIAVRKLPGIDVGSYHAVAFMTPLIDLIGLNLEVMLAITIYTK